MRFLVNKQVSEAAYFLTAQSLTLSVSTPEQLPYARTS